MSGRTYPIPRTFPSERACRVRLTAAGFMPPLAGEDHEMWSHPDGRRARYKILDDRTVLMEVNFIGKREQLDIELDKLAEMKAAVIEQHNFVLSLAEEVRHEQDTETR